MDRTTLSRNLRPLKRAGLVKVGPEGWRRSRALEITSKGRSRLNEELPVWQKAQGELRQRLGAKEFENVSDSLDKLTSAR